MCTGPLTNWRKKLPHCWKGARNKAQCLCNAAHREEVIFTRGTTEGINLVAHVIGRVEPGQDIVISELEHHSNIVPWQLLAQRTGANIKAIDIDEQGNLDLRRRPARLPDNTALLAITHISNGLGSVNPDGHPHPAGQARRMP